MEGSTGPSVVACGGGSPPAPAGMGCATATGSTIVAGCGCGCARVESGEVRSEDIALAIA
eukprot:2221522-Pleurochrysis_carterae.AAC.1